MSNRALSDINTTPTDSMSKEAIRGLKWRKEFGRGGTAVGVARARDLKNKKDLSISTIKRMFSFFSRHEIDKKAEGFRPGEKGYPSNGRIAWSLWGGDSGFSWSKRKVKEIKDMEEKNLDDMTLKELRHIQRIEETEDSIIIYYGKSKEDVEMVVEPSEEEVIDESYLEQEEEKSESRSIPNKEVRTFNVENLELRVDGDNKNVVGYGAVFGSLSNDLGGFRELISPKAFEGRLEDDVRFLINHDGLPLARTINGTLRLFVDEKGLRYEASMPDTTLSNDLMELLKNGTISQSSFAFIVEDDSWEVKDGVNIRTINKVSRLFDVSAVTYPAYEEASSNVALRSMEEWKEQSQEEKLKKNLKKEIFDNKKEESDLHKRNLAELRLKIKSNN